jgi:hypothetical protein
MAEYWTVTEDAQCATRIDGIVVRFLKEAPDPSNPNIMMPAGIGIALSEHPEAKYHNGNPWYLQPENIPKFRALVESQGIWFPLAEGTLDEWCVRVHTHIPLREFPHIFVHEFVGVRVATIGRYRNDGWRILHIAPHLAASGRYDVLMEKDGMRAPQVEVDDDPFTVSR